MKTFFLETRTSTFGIFNNARNTCGSLKFKYVDVKIFPEIHAKPDQPVVFLLHLSH